MKPYTLDVFISGSKVGELSQTDICEFTFAYVEGAKHAISKTMPVRAEPYVSPFLHPVFQVSLPQGRLRQSIENQAGKYMSVAGDIQVLAVVGCHLIGSMQIAEQGVFLPRKPGARTIERRSDVLNAKIDKAYIADFIERHALHSGVSGGFDKALATALREGDTLTVATEQHIVKFEDDDHPSLSVVEYFSMEVPRRVGIDTSNMLMSADGTTVLVERFDAPSTPGASVNTFEDMCSLMGQPADHKFLGSAEKVIKAIKDYCSPETKAESLKRFFTQYAICSMIRNGDAHLKNFGLLTDARTGLTSLSPCYDVVSMSVYAGDIEGRANDQMALNYNGTKRWLSNKDMVTLGARCGINKAEVDAIVTRIADVMREVITDAHDYAKSNPAHQLKVSKMSERWIEGLSSLGLSLTDGMRSKPKFR